MSKRQAAQLPASGRKPLEPKITYNRSLSLDAPEGGVKLSHLRELMSEATDRGFGPDAKVSIRSSVSYMSDYQQIDISDKT